MLSAIGSGTFKIGGDLPVRRLGYGAMHLTGPGVWGAPRDKRSACSVLRRAVELGINLIDTADVYGPDENERIIHEALHPYTPGLVIGTKAGLVRKGPNGSGRPLRMNGSDHHIRRAIEHSLKLLGVECLDLYQLHRIDPDIPLEETMETFRALQREGKIRHVGLSEVSVDEIKRARAIVEIATVQNLYNLGTRKHEDVLSYCEQNNIGFIPWYPLHIGTLAESPAMSDIASRTGCTPSQIALAWMLKRSSAMLLIPGTTSVQHLEQNVAACDIVLSPEDMEALDQAVDRATSEEAHAALTSAGASGLSGVR